MYILSTSSSVLEAHFGGVENSMSGHGGKSCRNGQICNNKSACGVVIK